MKVFTKLSINKAIAIAICNWNFQKQKFQVYSMLHLILFQPFFSVSLIILISTALWNKLTISPYDIEPSALTVIAEEVDTVTLKSADDVVNLTGFSFFRLIQLFKF